MCKFSKQTICHLSKKNVFNFVHQVKTDPNYIYHLAYADPAHDRNCEGHAARHGWRDYKDSAAVREITQGEG